MRRRIALVLAAIAAGAPCAWPVGAAAQVEEAGNLPSTGPYLSLDGVRHEVVATGPTQFRVTSGGGLCIDLVRAAGGEEIADLREMVRKLGLVRFSGHVCGRRAAAGGWNGSFSTKRPDRLFLYPPGVFADRTVRPIELVAEPAPAR